MLHRRLHLLLTLSLLALAPVGSAQNRGTPTSGADFLVSREEGYRIGHVLHEESRAARRLDELRRERAIIALRIEDVRRDLDRARLDEAQLLEDVALDERDVAALQADIDRHAAAIVATEERIALLERRRGHGRIRHDGRYGRRGHIGRASDRSRHVAQDRALTRERLQLDELLRAKERLLADHHALCERLEVQRRRLRLVTDEIVRLDAECVELVARCDDIDARIAEVEHRLRRDQRRDRNDDRYGRVGRVGRDRDRRWSRGRDRGFEIRIGGFRFPLAAN